MSDEISVRLRRIREASKKQKKEEARIAGRAFITSYQKSGTHQIAPMFLPMLGYVTDASNTQFVNLPDCYRHSSEIHWEAVDATCKKLDEFTGVAFGHIAYRPEFAKAMRGAKVLFNVRDPRDVIVAEYERIKYCYKIKKDVHGWLNYRSTWGGEEHWLFEGHDPIMELIEIAAAKWPMWLGWLTHDFVMQVKYEDLRLDPNPTVERIRYFIAPYQAADHDTMVEKALPRKRNPTFRKGAVGEWRDYFKPRHVEAAEALLGNTIERLGYEL